MNEQESPEIVPTRSKYNAVHDGRAIDKHCETGAAIQTSEHFPLNTGHVPVPGHVQLGP
jgi:hypothetical protein